MTSSTSFDFTHFKYLNIGGGNFCHREDGWLNLDCFFADTNYYGWDKGAIDITHNLLEDKPIDLPDKCLRGVYTEHTIEHLPDLNVEYLFREIHRILRDGGMLKIAVPDAELIYNKLIDPETPVTDYPHAFIHGDETKEQPFLGLIITPLRDNISNSNVAGIINKYPMDYALNLLVDLAGEITPEMNKEHPEWHVSWWSYDKLKDVLERSGFKNVSGRLNRHGSGVKAFRKDYLDLTAHKITLRMECSKND